MKPTRSIPYLLGAALFCSVPPRCGAEAPLAFNLARGAPGGASAPAVLNYQGRVSVDGKNFNGTADFVFSIQDTNGLILWSSGSFPVVGATNPPPGASRLEVREGLYSIRLGDRGAGMPLLDADALRNAGAPFLRVWFNDGVKGWGQLAGEEPLKSLFNPARIRSGGTSANGALSAAQGDMILRELRELRGLLQKQKPPQPTPESEPPKLVTVPLGGSPSLGQTNAPLVLVEFTDYQCPFCKRAHDDLMPSLRKKYVESGQLRVVSRNFPLSFHPNAEPAARAALCADQQQQFWPMYDRLFALSTELNAANFLKAAAELKLDPQAFSACLEAKAVSAQIERDQRDAGTAGITGTPSFVLGRAAGEKVTGTLFVGAPPAAEFEAEGDREALEREATMKTPELNPARGPEIGLQMGVILAAAVALGVAYNDASPLGVRAARRGATASPPSVALAIPLAGASSAIPAPLLPTVARTSYVNQTVSMTLEMEGASSGPPLTAAAVNPAPAAPPSAMQFAELTWAQVKPLLAAGKVVVLDARLKANYDLSHIPGAISFPFTSPAVDVQLFALKYPKETQFVVYCGSEQCHLSQQVAEVLARICGYTNVSEMPGGYAEYLAAEPAGTAGTP